MLSLAKSQGHFFTETERNPKICMETEKIPNSHGNLEKEEKKLQVSYFLISRSITKPQ